MNKKFVRIIFLLIAISIISVLLSIGIGSVNIPFQTVFSILLNELPFSFESNILWTSTEENIVLMLRLPRILLGFIVGASLAVTGVAMQALVRNPLADPFVLGVSSGASAFATLGMIFSTFSFLGVYSLPISAFLGAFLTILIVFILSRVNGHIQITHLLLSGLVIALMMDAFTRIITLSAPNALGIHNATFWMSGSLAGAKWSYLTLPFVVMIFGITFLLINYRNLNGLLLGDDAARTLGINVKRTQFSLIFVCSILTGVTIAVAGTIGFVGLMIPHLTRILIGSNHKYLTIISAFLGGILVVWTDSLARILIAPQELPLGILTAILGGPIFIYLLKTKKGFTVR